MPSFPPCRFTSTSTRLAPPGNPGSGVSASARANTWSAFATTVMPESAPMRNRDLFICPLCQLVGGHRHGEIGRAVNVARILDVVDQLSEGRSRRVVLKNRVG